MNKQLALLSVTLFFSCHGMLPGEKELLNKLRALESVELMIRDELYGAARRGEVNKVKELLQRIATIVPVKKLEDMSPTEKWSEQERRVEVVASAVNGTLAVAAANSDKQGPKEVFFLLLDPCYNPYVCRMGWKERSAAAKACQHTCPALAEVLLIY
jgi:hypothetical protein